MPKRGRPPGSTKITPEIVEGLFQLIIVEERGIYESCALLEIGYSTLWRWRQRGIAGGNGRKSGLYKRLSRIFTYVENQKLEALQAKQTEILRRLGYFI